MNYEQKQILQRLAAVQDLQPSTSEPALDLDSLYLEAEALIAQVSVHGDTESLEDLETYWGEAMASLGGEWEALLDEVLTTAEEAFLAEIPYHHNGEMYWRVLDNCYQLLQEKQEDTPFHRQLFMECLLCLRATATLQESLGYGGE